MSNSESTTSLDKQTGKNTGLVSFKTGIVEEAKVGWAIIRFPDLDDLLSKWIPVLYTKTQDDKGFWTPDVGEQVQCLMDDRLEDGCIMGAIYSEVDQPPTDDVDEYGIQFKDGGWFSYNRSTGLFKADIKGDAEITVDGTCTVKAELVVLDTPLVHCTGDVKVDGSVNADGDVTAGSISLQQHIHNIVVPVPGTPVTPPTA